MLLCRSYPEKFVNVLRFKSIFIKRKIILNKFTIKISNGVLVEYLFIVKKISFLSLGKI